MAEPTPQTDGIKAKMNGLKIYKHPTEPEKPMSRILMDPTHDSKEWFHLESESIIYNEKSGKSYQQFPSSFAQLASKILIDTLEQGSKTDASSSGKDPLEAQFQDLLDKIDRNVKKLSDLRVQVQEHWRYFQEKSGIRQKDILNSLYQKILSSQDLRQLQTNLYKFATYLKVKQQKEVTFRFDYPNRVYQKARDISGKFVADTDEQLEKIRVSVEEIAQITTRDELKYNTPELIAFETDKMDFGDILKSNVIPSDQLNTLCTLLNMKKMRTQLIFNAQEHGFMKFHEKCNYVSPTLIICQSDAGQIFGGLTEAKWNNSDSYLSDNNSILFSVTNQQTLNVQNPQNSVYSSAAWGPIFGGGPDLAITLQNNGEGSLSRLGHTYNSGNQFSLHSLQSSQFLAGATQFLIENYEVYKLLN